MITIQKIETITAYGINGKAEIKCLVKRIYKTFLCFKLQVGVDIIRIVDFKLI